MGLDHVRRLSHLSVHYPLKLRYYIDGARNKYRSPSSRGTIKLTAMAAIWKTHKDYTVAWICALLLEAAAATVMLEKTHLKLSQSTADDNVYTLGEITGHNIVIAYPVFGVYGITSVVMVATRMRSTFPSICFGLMIKIGGGVLSGKNDIRLGDIVVSKPTGVFDRVVQYGHGKTVTNGMF